MRGVIIIIVMLLSFSLVSAVFVEQGIEEALDHDDSVEVIVKLKDEGIEDKEVKISSRNLRYLDKKNIEKKLLKKRLDSRKENIKEKQDDVLERLKSKKVGILQDNDLKINHRYSLFNGFSGNVSKSALEKLKEDPDVESVFINRKVSAFLDNSIPQINADDVWEISVNGTNITGKGETICIIDTGIDYTHPALGGAWGVKVIGGYDFVNEDTDPMDDHGHGTHCAGIVASEDTTYRGVAPDSKLVAVKVLNNLGQGNNDDLIASIEWCINNSADYNISVISMSLGGNTKYNSYCNTGDVTSMINLAVQQDISVFAAAGNNWSGVTGIAWPACVENATPVGAVNDGDSISYQRGILLDILAPGINIKSTKFGGGFEDKSGTSMATPHAAGAAALMQQFSKSYMAFVLEPQEIEDILTETGKNIDDTVNSEKNYSRIDIYSAILKTEERPPIVELITADMINTSNVSIIINASVYDEFNNISSCVLEFDGTNQTMVKSEEGKNISCYLNKTIAGSGLFSYKIYANDSNNNMKESSVQQINIINSAPNVTSYYPLGNANIVEPENQTFNVTYSDINNDSLFVYWYKDNDLVSNSSEYLFVGDYLSYGNYSVSVIVSDGQANSSFLWNLTVNNTNRIPEILNISLSSLDPLNRTNGSLIATFNYTDPDNDTIIYNETRWYNDSIESENLRNLTTIGYGNITKDETWIFSVRVYDGNWSNWKNSSSIIIRNSVPVLDNIENVTVNETETVNITVIAYDNDNGVLNYTINDSRFTKNNNSFVWNTNLNDSGEYSFKIAVNDSESSDEKEVYVTVVDAVDFDNDNNPDFNDTDDDNDGIDDSADTLTGNASYINTSSTIRLKVNGSENLSKIFDSLLNVTIEDNLNNTLVEFGWNFSKNLKVNWSIEVNESEGSIRIRNLQPENKKTVYINKTGNNNYVCIADDEITSTISLGSCSGYTKIKCSGSSGQYTCTDLGSRFKIEGLEHSAVKGIYVAPVVSSGGGGGGGSSSSAATLTENFISKTLSKGNSFRFKHKGINHRLRLDDVHETYAEISIYSETIKVNATFNTAVHVDTDNNGKKDIEIIMVKKTVSRSEIKIRSIDEHKSIKIPENNCYNGIQDDNETDIDCGGNCKECGSGKRCTADSDCISFCIKGICRKEKAPKENVEEKNLTTIETKTESDIENVNEKGRSALTKWVVAISFLIVVIVLIIEFLQSEGYKRYKLEKRYSKVKKKYEKLIEK